MQFSSGGTHAGDVLRSLGWAELERRFWHIAPGFLPMLLWPISHRDPLSGILWVILMSVPLTLGIVTFIRYRHIARPGDRERIQSVWGYSGCVFAGFLLFPEAPEIGMGVLAILAFGDGTATLAGMLLRGPRLPWNHEKTWTGFLTFLLVGIPMASLIYWGETAFNPESEPASIPFSLSLVVAGTATALAAIAESLPSRLNDNVRVGVVGGLILVVLHAAIIGWG